MNQKKWLIGVSILSLTAFSLNAQDIGGATDHPDLGRIDGSTIVDYEHFDFDEVKLHNGKGKDATITKEGETTRIVYDLPLEMSYAQILRSLKNRLEEKGYVINWECDQDEYECGTSLHNKPYYWKEAKPKIDPNDSQREVLAQKKDESGETNILLLIGDEKYTKSDDPLLMATIVENKEFETAAVDALDTQTVTEELTAQGKMAFYDILFETDSATLKPSSEPTIGLIADVLKESPDLKVVIVGHTDNQGTLDYNIDLSRARAKSVADELTGALAINADRVTHAGVAYLAPVTTNETDEGRAKNRRVEVVVRSQ